MSNFSIGVLADHLLTLMKAIDYNATGLFPNQLENETKRQTLMVEYKEKAREFLKTKDKDVVKKKIDLDALANNLIQHMIHEITIASKVNFLSPQQYSYINTLYANIMTFSITRAQTSLDSNTCVQANLDFKAYMQQLRVSAPANAILRAFSDIALREDTESPTAELLKGKKSRFLVVMYSETKMVKSEATDAVDLKLAELNSGSSIGIRLLVSGPPGIGKSSLAEYIVGKFATNPNEYYKITIGNIEDPYRGVAEQAIKDFFDYYEKNHLERTVLLLDEIDQYMGIENGTKVGREIQAFIGNMSKYKNVVMVATTNYISKLPSEIVDRFTRINFPIPDASQFVNYLLNLLDVPNYMLLSTLNHLVKIIDKYYLPNFREVQRFAAAYSKYFIKLWQKMGTLNRIDGNYSFFATVSNDRKTINLYYLENSEVTFKNVENLEVNKFTFGVAPVSAVDTGATPFIASTELMMPGKIYKLNIPNELYKTALKTRTVPLGEIYLQGVAYAIDDMELDGIMKRDGSHIVGIDEDTIRLQQLFIQQRDKNKKTLTLNYTQVINDLISNLTRMET